MKSIAKMKTWKKSFFKDNIVERKKRNHSFLKADICSGFLKRHLTKSLKVSINRWKRKNPALMTQLMSLKIILKNFYTQICRGRTLTSTIIENQ